MKNSAGCKQKQQEENDTTLIKLFKIRDKEEKNLEANRMKLLQRHRRGFLLGNDASEETQTPLGR